MADATNGNLDEVKRALLTGLRYLLGFLHACAKILQQAVVVSTPVIRRLLFLSLKMFSSIISKLKSAVSSKESGEVVEEKERIENTPAEVAESPVEGGKAEKDAKEISDKKGKRSSTTPITAPKGDSEPVFSPKTKVAEKDGGGGDEEKASGAVKAKGDGGDKKGKKRGAKKKKTAATKDAGEEEPPTAAAPKALSKKKDIKEEGKTDAELEKENAKLMKEVSEATRKYRSQQDDIAKARRERKVALSVAAQLYQIGMGIEAKPSRARTDSITLPSLPSAGEQTKRGAQTARALGSASRSSRRGSQQGQGQPSFFMNNAGGQPRRGSVPNRPTGADKADLNQLIKEAKARQALLRAQSQTKLEGDSGGKTDPEEVRSRLRTGRTRQELEAAMNEAKELGMTYEATLAEKKLEGMKE